MFEKILDFQKNLSGVSCGGELPSEITKQFNSEALNRGLRLVESSRISHINFGREAYFGLISESSTKSFNVHVTLDPETRILSKANCGCFRSSTRTYCHHIVTFVRYILRTDEETGKLKSLCEDFQESFWNEISWFGFKNFGDSSLGFRAHVNHGGEGLRMTYSDRGSDEILSFMPGERLVDEFLHEFFEIIRRDIDPTVYKRMYGKKLKDPNVPSLRRKPWQYTEDELEINKRGIKSARQSMEESIWHRIAKVGFLLAGRLGGHFSFNFLEHREELIVEGMDEEGETIIRFIPPRILIGPVIERAEKKEIIGSNLFINPKPLETGYTIEVTESSALLIKPVVRNPDDEAGEENKFIDRSTLDKHLFGAYYFFPDFGFYRIHVSVANLPSEYFSPQKRVMVHPEKISSFLKENFELLRDEPSIIVDKSLLERETVENCNKVIVTHKPSPSGQVKIEISYDYGDFTVSFREILEAKRNNQRFIVYGSKWIDTLGAEFAWINSRDNAVEVDGDEITLSKVEYLRFLALQEKIEKRYESAKLRNWFEDLDGLKAPTRVPSVSSMKGRLRSYQKNGYGWLWFLYENGFSGLLCDDMGLGKTHQVMALMTGIHNRCSRANVSTRFIVVCPTTVLSHWYDKVLEYCPYLRPFIYHGADRAAHDDWEKHPLIITSYGIALRDREILSETSFDLMVLDEVQAVKNRLTKTYHAIKSLHAKCVIGLTGTPIENSVTELKSLFDITLPGYFVSETVFETYFRVPIEEESDTNAKDKLAKLIHPFTLRRKKEQVLKELPPKIEDIRRCDLSETQYRFYRDVVDNQGQELVQTLKDPDKTVPYMHIFAILNSLKQICDHPALLEGETKDYAKYESGKWDTFVDLLDESVRSGQKVVVFSQYVKMLELIESYLIDVGLNFSTIKGHTRKRAEAIRKFNTDPECKVFTASLRASGLGIDLTGGSVVIHYDRWWNAAREEQATDRVHRIGQQRGVQVFKLVTRNTLEEKIDTIILKKKRLMESVVRQDDKLILKHFSREDLIELISY